MNAIYRCPKLDRGESPHDEELVSTGYATPRAAMDEANRLARRDRAHTYMVGAA